ncbi:hypothetical protein VOLCADRAFT_88131 [Volvox carteri f. nagariensis]|uniref:Uncharacterized protein n=1 Tax=Volvox carteri f. nagariensis TaxID=3068 RepID=D8TND0_VOLCA|nr:uncharacterized protein VOLCADRAFT_88131 [Volvox carteri f. nagariensis]EFJ50969.1 hypothetical protein VOLCADRAFT_88131 [Volvox carteri f. nagariensis]|eukprot:XP_002947981.1 hypothetical protein VOLCADRAFT_88131 [Volvox carteri f. nagariensis]
MTYGDRYGGAMYVSSDAPRRSSLFGHDDQHKARAWTVQMQDSDSEDPAPRTPPAAGRKGVLNRRFPASGPNGRVAPPAMDNHSCPGGVCPNPDMYDVGPNGEEYDIHYDPTSLRNLPYAAMAKTPQPYRNSAMGPLELTQKKNSKKRTARGSAGEEDAFEQTWHSGGGGGPNAPTRWGSADGSPGVTKSHHGGLPTSHRTPPRLLITHPLTPRELGADGHVDRLTGGMDGLFLLAGCFEGKPIYIRSRYSGPPGEDRVLYYNPSYGSWEFAVGREPSTDQLVLAGDEGYVTPLDVPRWHLAAVFNSQRLNGHSGNGDNGGRGSRHSGSDENPSKEDLEREVRELREYWQRHEEEFYEVQYAYGDYFPEDAYGDGYGEPGGYDDGYGFTHSQGLQQGTKLHPQPVPAAKVPPWSLARVDMGDVPERNRFGRLLSPLNLSEMLLVAIAIATLKIVVMRLKDGGLQGPPEVQPRELQLFHGVPEGLITHAYILQTEEAARQLREIWLEARDGSACIQQEMEGRESREALGILLDTKMLHDASRQAAIVMKVATVTLGGEVMQRILAVVGSFAAAVQAMGLHVESMNAMYSAGCMKAAALDMAVGCHTVHFNVNPDDVSNRIMIISTGEVAPCMSDGRPLHSQDMHRCLRRMAAYPQLCTTYLRVVVSAVLRIIFGFRAGDKVQCEPRCYMGTVQYLSYKVEESGHRALNFHSEAVVPAFRIATIKSIFSGSTAGRDMQAGLKMDTELTALHHHIADIMEGVVCQLLSEPYECTPAAYVFHGRRWRPFTGSTPPVSTNQPPAVIQVPFPDRDD